MSPTVVATTEFGGESSFAVTDGVVGGSAVIKVRNNDSELGAKDDPFHFIVVGPR